MEIDGVLLLDGRPVLYLKECREYKNDDPFWSSERVRLHKLFWNQGVANVLVLIDSDSVSLYSGLVKPGSKSKGEKSLIQSEESLIQSFTQADFAQRIHTLFQQLATGRFYEDEKHWGKFNPEQSVDSLLLQNLRDFRDKLIAGDNKLEIEEAHAFLGRILFLCYLLDRGIVPIDGPDQSGTATTRFAGELARREDDDARIDYLYEIFEGLRERFNGNMFDRDLDAEKQRIRPHLGKLLLLLGGGEIKTGQISLWPYYDFKMIPVETISAIYQDFLGAEDKERQRETGAIYTPRFLAERVVDVAMGGEPEAWDWSFLDPACGSGIFLVLLFHRLAARRLAGLGTDDYVARAEVLQDILKNRIRGVDISETACRIACFSLYLAYLDFFESSDLDEYMKKTGEKLPRLLEDPDNPRQSPNIPVIRKGDFLALGDVAFKGEEFPDGKFHCLIGNPPWGGRGSKQIAQKFMQETPRFLKENGIGCLLLPTKILHNKTDEFQAKWFRRVTLEKVLQLADYRKLLFQGAKTPAFIARFMNAAPDPNRHTVEFIAPKFNRAGLRKGVITIDPAARARIRLADILVATRSKTVPIVWKQHLWGTRRDRKLLDLLLSLPPLSELAGRPKEGKRWIGGVGFQPSKTGKIKSAQLPWWNKSHLYIHAKSPFWASESRYMRKDDCEVIGDRFPNLHRSRDERIYKGPMVLAGKGFSKVAYCDFDILFQDFLLSIAGPGEDAEILMFLAAYLRSELAKYFLFHTNANLGVERDQVYVPEYRRLPFPLPGDDFIASDATEIIREIAEKVREFGETPQSDFPKAGPLQTFFRFPGEDTENIDGNRNTKKRPSKPRGVIGPLQREIDPLIYRYFGLTDQEILLVEDTVAVFMPSATPGSRNAPIPTLDPVEEAKVAPYNEQGLCAYGNILAGTLNSWVRDGNSPYRVRAEVGVEEKMGLAMATLHLVEGEPETLCREKSSISASLAEALKSYRETLSKEAGTLLYERDIFFFQEDCIHIVRPNLLIHWTRTMALNDAAQIYGEILIGERQGHAG
uniref:site-specific DNA-methyltransferase (adenine-specific) n=1 Tax=Candidatus Kentrum sp. SD TaxID=2126332 RepID=A0A450Y8E1_9GAMM|nr:MAG: Methyltransferase domain-containing protein [Candidatus Kentron sp. SD]VFK42454.1 MAG: Methyltransferase domain-containing protein [Candidatus Kentron sp. SD]